MVRLERSGFAENLATHVPLVLFGFQNKTTGGFFTTNYIVR